MGGGAKEKLGGGESRIPKFFWLELPIWGMRWPHRNAGNRGGESVAQRLEESR